MGKIHKEKLGARELKERNLMRTHNSQVALRNEQLRFQAEKGLLEHPRIEHGRWINALTNDAFTWQLTVTFPRKLPKDDRMKRFKEMIQRAFEAIYLSQE